MPIFEHLYLLEQKLEIGHKFSMLPFPALDKHRAAVPKNLTALGELTHGDLDSVCVFCLSRERTICKAHP